MNGVWHQKIPNNQSGKSRQFWKLNTVYPILLYRLRKRDRDPFPSAKTHQIVLMQSDLWKFEFKEFVLMYTYVFLEQFIVGEIVRE